MSSEYTENAERWDDRAFQDLGLVLGDDLGRRRRLVHHIHVPRLDQDIEKAALKPTLIQRLERDALVERVVPLLDGRYRLPINVELIWSRLA